MILEYKYLAACAALLGFLFVFDENLQYECETKRPFFLAVQLPNKNKENFRKKSFQGKMKSLSNFFEIKTLKFQYIKLQHAQHTKN
jgi:hypothetical protein